MEEEQLGDDNAVVFFQPYLVKCFLAGFMQMQGGALLSLHNDQHP